MVDNACREFLFVSEFFILDATSALEIFNNIFGKTIQLLVKHTDSHITDSFDCISIFLCIHLVQVTVAFRSCHIWLIKPNKEVKDNKCITEVPAVVPQAMCCWSGQVLGNPHWCALAKAEYGEKWNHLFACPSVQHLKINDRSTVIDAFQNFRWCSWTFSR